MWDDLFEYYGAYEPVTDEAYLEKYGYEPINLFSLYTEDIAF